MIISWVTFSSALWEKGEMGLEMAVINVHPSPAEVAGKHVVVWPGNQNAQGKEGWEEEVMKAEGF